MKKTKSAFIILFLIYCLLTSPVSVQASELSDYDFSGIEELLASEGSSYTFTEMVSILMSGDFSQFSEMLVETIKTALLGDLGTGKDLLIRVLLISILGALFTAFSSVFENGYLTETGFFVTYMLLITLLLSIFSLSATIVESTLSGILNFVTMLMPAFFLAVAVSGGLTTSAAFYTFATYAVTATEWLVLKLILPIVYVMALLVVINHLMKDDMFSKLIDLLKTLVEWCLKTMVGIVTGISLIQSLILPPLDNLKEGTLIKALGSIPGIGNSINSVTSMALGAGVLIKNSIGAAGAIVLFVLVSGPVIKLALIGLMQQGVNAFMQPLSDKRLVSCVSDMGALLKLLLKILYTTVLLFLILIAIICAFGNRG